MAATRLINILTGSTGQQAALKLYGFHTYIQDTIDQLADTLELIKIARKAVQDTKNIPGLPLCNVLALAAAIKNAEATVLSLFPGAGGNQSTLSLVEKVKGGAQDAIKKGLIFSDPGWYTTALARVSTDIIAKLAAMNWELSLVVARMVMLSSKGDSPTSASSEQEMRCADKGRLKAKWDEAQQFDKLGEDMLKIMENMKREVPREKEREHLRGIEPGGKQQNLLALFGHNTKKGTAKKSSRKSRRPSAARNHVNHRRSSSPLPDYDDDLGV